MNENKVCMYCRKDDRQDEMFDNSTIFQNYKQHIHPECYDELKEKTNQ